MIKEILKHFKGAKEKIKGDNLKWSDNPGCFERHLQRRFQNPLFPRERMLVTEDELKQAKNLDNAEQNLFRKEKITFNQKMESLKQKEFNVQLYKEIQDLIEKGYSIGGSISEEIAELEKIEKLIYNALNIDNPELKELLDKASALSSMVRDPFYASCKRKDTPIREEESLASLLCEDFSTIATEGLASRTFPGYRPNENDFIQIVYEAISKELITKEQADNFIKAWKEF